MVLSHLVKPTFFEGRGARHLSHEGELKRLGLGGRGLRLEVQGTSVTKVN